MSSGVANQLYHRIVLEYVEPIMRKEGYEKSGREWFYKWRGDSLQRLSCGFNKRKNHDEGYMQVFVCVGFKSLAEFLSKWPDVSIHDKERPCAMATDLGHLAPEYGHNYNSWRILPDADPDQIGREVQGLICKYAFPYLEYFGSLDNTVAAWESGVQYNLGYGAAFYLAVAYWLRGERERAIAHVEQSLARLMETDRHQGWHTESSVKNRFRSFLLYLRSQA